MPEVPPEGVFPIFLRGVTCEKFGFKTGEGIQDLVEYKHLQKDEILKEMQDYGVMSDFTPAKKEINLCTSDKLLIVIDKQQTYGEMFLLYYTEASQDTFNKKIIEKQLAIENQKRELAEAEEARKAAEWARLNVVFDDVPLTPRPWVAPTIAETENEIKILNHQPVREKLSIEISRPKKLLRLPCRFNNRDADVGGLQEFRAHKDPHFTVIRESDIGIQAAPSHGSSSAQTTWYRSINKAVQYEAAVMKVEPTVGDIKDEICVFLENATIKIELALQQNETVDIFHETFRMTGDEESLEGLQAENELREIKNFADPTYSKMKVLAAIDWMPKAVGMVAVSAVRKLSFDQRVSYSGQTNTAYILIWDFRQLVKPQILLQCAHESFTMRFNATNPNIIVGGCITGQVVLWDISEANAALTRKGNRGSSSTVAGAGAGAGSAVQNNDNDEDDSTIAPVIPKFLSNVDHSHKRAVADLMWLPPNTQINYRGQLVNAEYLDGVSHQFITVAGDGQVMVWDTRFESIASDELRHIGRSKHIPLEKTLGKDGAGGGFRPLWTPIFKAHLKRLEGVGELSLSKISSGGSLSRPSSSNTSKSHTADSRSQFLISTEEGDILLADLSTRKVETTSTKEEEEEEVSESREFVRWLEKDHSRPCVCLQHSPFFPDIVLSVGDSKFNIWKVGEERPLFTSPTAHTYLTAGAWSPTRAAVLVVACADGSLLVWDFTDSSYRHSIELKATHTHISSLEFLSSSVASSRQQLLAVGDDTGTLHIFEIPRNLTRPVHREDIIMANFVDRELKRMSYLKENSALSAATLVDDDRHGINEIMGTASGVGGNSTQLGGNSLQSQSQSQSLPGRLDADHTEDNKVKVESAEVIKKEEEEFAKLEAMFISELGLTNNSLPSYAKIESLSTIGRTSSMRNVKR